MIYLNDDIIVLPNLYEVESPTFTIELVNNTTNEKTFTNVVNESENELYYQFSLVTSSLSENEYTLYLFDSEMNLLGTWLARKGIDDEPIISFNTNTVEYIEFEP